MLKPYITAQDVIDTLNEALQADTSCIQEMFEPRYMCNEKLAGHPTIQVGSNQQDETVVGIIGLLNGLFGVDKAGWGCLGIVYDVVCPNKHKVKAGLVIGDVCPICEAALELGALREFKLIKNNATP